MTSAALTSYSAEVTFSGTPRRLRWRAIVQPGEQFHVARTQHSRHLPCPLHTHDFAEVFWVDAGRACHVINGRRVRLEPGQLWFVRPAEAHAFEAEGAEAVEITNIAFPRDAVDFLRSRYPQASARCWDGRLEPARLDAAQRRVLNQAANRLALAERDRLPLDHFLLELLCALRGAAADEPAPDAPEWLADACREIRAPERLREGLPALYRLAARCPEHVARVMRRTMGLTPTQYLNARRVAAAAFLLRMTTKPVTEIALEVGYENLGHFFEVFRRTYGVTPRTYRHETAVPGTQSDH